LLTSLSGAAYVLPHSAAALVAAGAGFYVQDAPPISQPIFAGITMRNRHRAAYRKLMRLAHDQFGPKTQGRPKA